MNNACFHVQTETMDAIETQRYTYTVPNNKACFKQGLISSYANRH